MVQFVVYFYAV